MSLSASDTNALVASWTEVIRGHSILRSAFYNDVFSMPVQCVFRDVTLPVTELDYRGMAEAAQEAAIQEYQAADRIKGFDFKRAADAADADQVDRRADTGCYGPRIICCLTAGRCR